MPSPTATSSPADCLAEIKARLQPLRSELAAHPLYTSLRTIEHLRTFMEFHVYAVWDFMSLLKALQRTLTCVSLPWSPTPHPASRRFINEIVLGEESDLYQGRPVSHFELYLEAMDQAGAQTDLMRGLLRHIAARNAGPAGPSLPASPTRAGVAGEAFGWVGSALDQVPAGARTFMETTFAIIGSGSPAALAAAFTFGREDAIPEMFRSLVHGLNRQSHGRVSIFLWYLERHIEVDGDDHGPLSLKMVADLCGDDPALWQEAAAVSEAALRSRLALWDAITAAL